MTGSVISLTLFVACLCLLQEAEASYAPSHPQTLFCDADYGEFCLLLVWILSFSQWRSVRLIVRISTHITPKHCQYFLVLIWFDFLTQFAHVVWKQRFNWDFVNRPLYAMNEYFGCISLRKWVKKTDLPIQHRAWQLSFLVHRMLFQYKVRY
jgi:hypothetical protein